MSGSAPGLEQWAARYRAEVRGFQLDAIQARTARDFEALEGIGHRLRGSGSVFGYPLLSDIGAELEDACLAEDESRVQSAVQRLERWDDSQEVVP